MSNELSIISPALNEQKNIEPLTLKSLSIQKKLNLKLFSLMIIRLIKVKKYS